VTSGAGAPPSLVTEFLRALPFALTGAQRRALAVIFADLAGPLPMHRLLQGDVARARPWWPSPLCSPPSRGASGSTDVPTEVLAEQHFFAVQALTESLVVEDPGRLEAAGRCARCC